MLDIKKIEIADETKPFIEVSTESDFSYSIRINELCTVKTYNDNIIKGKLDYVGDDCLKIKTEDIGEIMILYSAIVEIIEADGFRIY